MIPLGVGDVTVCGPDILPLPAPAILTIKVDSAAFDDMFRTYLNSNPTRFRRYLLDADNLGGCLQGALGAFSPPPEPGDFGNLLDAAGDEAAALDAGTAAAKGLSAKTLGSVMGTVAGVPAPTRAGLTAAGAQLQRFIESTEPAIKSGGILLGVVSAGYRGYQGFATDGFVGGLRSASFGAIDVGVETMLSGAGLPGVAAAVSYEKFGGSETIAKGAAANMMMNACLTQFGIPVRVH